MLSYHQLIEEKAHGPPITARHFDAWLMHWDKQQVAAAVIAKRKNKASSSTAAATLPIADWPASANLFVPAPPPPTPPPTRRNNSIDTYASPHLMSPLITSDEEDSRNHNVKQPDRNDFGYDNDEDMKEENSVQDYGGGDDFGNDNFGYDEDNDDDDDDDDEDDDDDDDEDMKDNDSQNYGGGDDFGNDDFGYDDNDKKDTKEKSSNQHSYSPPTSPLIIGKSKRRKRRRLNHNTSEDQSDTETIDLSGVLFTASSPMNKSDLPNCSLQLVVPDSLEGLQYGRVGGRKVGPRYPNSPSAEEQNADDIDVFDY